MDCCAVTANTVNTKRCVKTEPQPLSIWPYSIITAVIYRRSHATVPEAGALDTLHKLTGMRETAKMFPTRSIRNAEVTWLTAHELATSVPASQCSWAFSGCDRNRTEFPLATMQHPEGPLSRPLCQAPQDAIRTLLTGQSWFNGKWGEGARAGVFRALAWRSSWRARLSARTRLRFKHGLKTASSVCCRTALTRLSMTPSTPTHQPLRFRAQICRNHNSGRAPSHPACPPPLFLSLWWQEKWHTFVHVNQLLLLLLALLLLPLCFLLRQLGSLDLLLHLPLLVVLLHCFLMRHTQADKNQNPAHGATRFSVCHYCIAFRSSSTSLGHCYSGKGLIVPDKLLESTKPISTGVLVCRAATRASNKVQKLFHHFIGRSL